MDAAVPSLCPNFPVQPRHMACENQTFEGPAAAYFSDHIASPHNLYHEFQDKAYMGRLTPCEIVR